MRQRIGREQGPPRDACGKEEGGEKGVFEFDFEEPERVKRWYEVVERCRVLAEELAASKGEVTRARELGIGYFAQHQVEQLDLDASSLVGMQRIDPGLSEREIRAYLGGFNFRGDKVLQPVSTFSGGQKARLVLALLIWQKPNLLLLDEPTNHLLVRKNFRLVGIS